jgi:signal transduction histidine kinase
MKGQGILIVEDENIVALDMCMRLESMGYSVLDVVDTADLALEKAAELSPQLVLMDIKLKGDQDGIEAAIQLRKSQEVPVIFVTAFTDERTLDRAKRASPYGYIVKPFHERELKIAIELAIYKYQYELSIRKAKDIAEESNRVKGDFLANMSHELKTPLNSVIGFTELALVDPRDREQKEYLSIVLSSAKSLLTLINSILDFARMEAGKLTAVPAPFNVDELLEECGDSLAIAAAPKRIHVSLSRDPAIPDVLVGDVSLLKHILLNLLDNAVKFTEAGRVRLAVGMLANKELPGRGPTLRFEVSDTGIGMEKDKIQTAFERFSQLDSSKTRKAGGTGLGLAIVAKSVELMGGEIIVESEPSRGTRFIVTIPFEQGSADPASREAIPAGRISVVGFDDETYSDIALALSRLGFEPRKAASVEAASLVEGQYALVSEDVLVDSEHPLSALNGKKVVVATRLGGDSRSKMSGMDVAFASQPIRDSGLRKAFDFLESGGRGTTQSAKPRNGAVRAHIEDKDLPGLVQAMSRELAGGALAEAERLAKEVQNALAEAGEAEGTRMAFSVLLATRRGDRETARESMEKIQMILGIGGTAKRRDL